MKYQLILTSLDKMFSNDRKPVFLEDWCLKYRDKEFWEKIDFEMAPDIWERNMQTSIDSYCLNLIDRLNCALADMLNSFYNEMHTTRYWKSMLTTWLYAYVYKLYKCYLEVTKTFEKYNDIKVNVLKIGNCETR